MRSYPYLFVVATQSAGHSPATWLGATLWVSGRQGRGDFAARSKLAPGASCVMPPGTLTRSLTRANLFDEDEAALEISAQTSPPRSASAMRASSGVGPHCCMLTRRCRCLSAERNLWCAPGAGRTWHCAGGSTSTWRPATPLGTWGRAVEPPLGTWHMREEIPFSTIANNQRRKQSLFKAELGLIARYGETSTNVLGEDYGLDANMSAKGLPRAAHAIFEPIKRTDPKVPNEKSQSLGRFQQMIGPELNRVQKRRLFDTQRYPTAKRVRVAMEGGPIMDNEAHGMERFYYLTRE